MSEPPPLPLISHIHQHVRPRENTRLVTFLVVLHSFKLFHPSRSNFTYRETDTDNNHSRRLFSSSPFGLKAFSHGLNVFCTQKWLCREGNHFRVGDHNATTSLRDSRNCIAKQSCIKSPRLTLHHKNESPSYRHGLCNHVVRHGINFVKFMILSVPRILFHNLPVNHLQATHLKVVPAFSVPPQMSYATAISYISVAHLIVRSHSQKRQ